MAATNYTPIQLYYSTTASAAPTAGNLTSGELAINITDGKLYYKDNGGVVQVIATKGAGTIGGSTTQIQYNNAGALAGSAAMTFNNSTNVVTLTTLNLTNALGATYGGTAQSAYAQGDVLYASAANTLSKLGIGTVNYILTSTGSVPQWSAPSSITVQTATNLAGGAGGSVPYQSAADTTTFLAIGAANRVMTSSGTAPQWVTALTGLTGVSSSSITNTSLTATRLVYSSTAGLQTDSANLTFDGTTLSATGYSTTGLSTLVKTVKIGDSNFSGVAVFAPSTPAKLYIGTGTVTDTTSAIGATNAAGAIASLAITPIAATNTSVTYTNASTLYIAGAPSAGTNVTITNPYSLYVAAGASYFGTSVTSPIYYGTGEIAFQSNASVQTQSSTYGASNTVFRLASSTTTKSALAGIYLGRFNYISNAGTNDDFVDKTGLYIRGFYNDTGSALPIYIGGYSYSSQVPYLTVTTDGRFGFRTNNGTTAGNPTQTFQVGYNASASTDAVYAAFNAGNFNGPTLALTNWTGSATTYGPRVSFDNSGFAAWYVGGSNASSRFEISNTWGAPVISAFTNGDVTVGASQVGARLCVVSAEAKTSSSTLLGFGTSTGGVNDFQMFISRTAAGAASSAYRINVVEQGLAYRNLALQDDGGSVTIGTTTSAAKLTVVTTSTDVASYQRSSSSSQAAIHFKNDSAWYTNYIDQDNTATKTWSIYDTTNGNSMIRYTPGASGSWKLYTNNTLALQINNSQYVGLGIDNALTRLDVRGSSASAASTVQITGNGVSTLLLGQNGDGGVLRGQGANNMLQFWVGGTGDTGASLSGYEVGRFNSSGDFLITRLSAGTATTGFFYMSPDPSAGTYQRALGLGVPGTNSVSYNGQYRFYVSAGNGNVQKPGMRLQIRVFDDGSGSEATIATAIYDAWYQGNNSSTWSVTSDERIKTNIQKITGALDIVCALDGDIFELKTAPGIKRSGFIAQKFERVLPSMVKSSPPEEAYKPYIPEGESIKTLNAELAPYFVEAIKELRAEFEAYKASHP